VNPDFVALHPGYVSEFRDISPLVRGDDWPRFERLIDELKAFS
jgi:hypothetical protein